MNIEQWNIEKPIPYDKNPRVIAESAITKVATSIKEFGFRQPIVVDKEGIVIVGHARLLAAKRIGLKKVPVHVARDLSAKAARAYRIADNRTNQEASWDDALLSEELQSLLDEGYNLTITGFEEKELKKLLAEENSQSGGEDTEPKLDGLVYKIIITCGSEDDQAATLAKLESLGLNCQLLIA